MAYQALYRKYRPQLFADVPRPFSQEAQELRMCWGRSI